MGHVKAPEIPWPKRGLTDFERKIADILFAETSRNELQVERVLDVAIVISDGLTKDAVEGEVHKMGNIAYIKEISQDAIQGALKDFADGDKVKLIIVKED